MANVIKLKRGSGSDPGASDLVVGEIALRTDTGKIFTKKDDGSVAEISGSGGGGNNFKINTISQSNGTGGGSATFNGSAYRFTLSDPPGTSCAQCLVSVNGVIQKPVAGSSQPAEGFAISGNDILFSSAPASGADYFIVTYDALSVTAVTDNSIDEGDLKISNAGSNGQFLQKQSGNTGGLTWASVSSYTHPNHSGEVTSSGDGATTIASNVVDEDNLKVSNSPTNGYFLSAQSGNTGGLTWAAIPAGVGGSTGVDFDQDTKIRFGDSNEYELFADSNSLDLKASGGTGTINIVGGTSSGAVFINVKNTNVAEFYGGSGGGFYAAHNGNHMYKTEGGVNTFLNHVRVSADSTYDIGTSSVRFANGYFDTLYGSGANLTALPAAQLSGAIANGVTATTQSASDNSTKVATTAYTDTAISNLVDSSPSALNTLNELAAALGDDANFSTTVTNSIATKLPLAGGTLTGALSTNSDIRLAADGGSGRLEIGALSGGDLQLYHATNSYIINKTGDLYLYTSDGNDFYVAGQDGHTIIKGTDGSSVELFHNNTKRFETTTHGVNITGTDGGGSQVYGDMYWDNTSNAGKDLMWDQSVNKLSFADDVKATFGGDSSGGDLQIYHSGSHSFVDNTTGDLVLKGSAIQLKGSNNENMIIANQNLAVELYFNNIKALTTTTNGAEVWASEGNDASLYLYADEADDLADQWRLRAWAADQVLSIESRNSGGYYEKNIACVADGAVEIYFANSKKLETRSTGVHIEANNDIRFANGNWTGDTYGKIQQHDNALYVVGSSNGIRFRGTTNADHWYVKNDGHFWPAANNSYDIGSSSNRVRNLYINDLQLSNKGSQNDVDGTWGDWTLQEGEEDIFMINNRSGKKYKMALQEVS